MKAKSGRIDFEWVDGIKGLALMWIFCNHIVEATLDAPFIGNPESHWPSLEMRIAQFLPLTGHGIWNVPLNLVRYLGWFGDQGVHLFLIISGFGLTWGILSRGGMQPFRLRDFYLRRALRIFPLWWAAHIFFILTGILLGFGLPARGLNTCLSMLGIRFTPHLFFFFSPAWWYIGLLIQLYLIFPLLWKMVLRWGALRLFVGATLLSFASRSVGFCFFENYLDKWSLGAVFITRLPEFSFGILLACYFHSSAETTEGLLRTPKLVVGAFMAYIIGNGLSLTLPGMVIAPAIVGITGFVLAYHLYRVLGFMGPLPKLVRWIGKHSYSLFLVHHPFILAFVEGRTFSSFRPLALVISGVVLLTVLVALFIEKVTDTATTVATKRFREEGIVGVAVPTLGLILLGVFLGLGSELVVREFTPQEVLGWGERPSLIPDAVCGWKLKPSMMTRLRWESYDYRVTSNSLGFPGPQYPVNRAEGTLRIMTTGDAFTSAEGVDTKKAWPRLLESALSRKLPGEFKSVEVLNFAITAYGPNEYLAVSKQYVPIYKPQLVLVEFFVNEFADVLMSESLRENIGFELPPADGWYSFFHLLQLRQYMEYHVKEPLAALLRNRTAHYGYFLGNFSALERGKITEESESYKLVRSRLSDIEAICNENGAKMILILVPAPVQVCGPKDLAYYPPNVNLSNNAKFDVEQPQRLTVQISKQLNIEFIDLIRVLKDSSRHCPYQAWNMHWTEEGHKRVGDYLATVLSERIEKSRLDGLQRNGDK